MQAYSWSFSANLDSDLYDERGPLVCWISGGSTPLVRHHAPFSLCGISTPGYQLLFPGNITPSPQPYLMNELPSGDKSTLIDIKDFKFIINNDACNKTQPLLLMLLRAVSGTARGREQKV
ncbi:hypothetical protein KM043_015585 [Ampulex compressa]|nr:hypothetical protein KM043_015585 [Ampulex compressa]